MISKNKVAGEACGLRHHRRAPSVLAEHRERTQMRRKTRASRWACPLPLQSSMARSGMGKFISDICEKPAPWLCHNQKHKRTLFIVVVVILILPIDLRHHAPNRMHRLCSEDKINSLDSLFRPHSAHCHHPPLCYCWPWCPPAEHLPPKPRRWLSPNVTEAIGKKSETSLEVCGG